MKAGDLVGGGVRGYSLVPRGGQRHMDTHRYTHACVHGEGCTPWCHEVGKCAHARAHTHTHTHTQHTHTHAHPCPAIDPACSPTGSSREKKELQKILDRKRHNSISEAKTREKHKKEA